MASHKVGDVVTTRSALLLLACLALMGCATPIPPPLPQVIVGEPSPTSVASGGAEPAEAPPNVICNRVDRTTCETAVDLARAATGSDGVPGTSLIVVVDVCPPTVMCDRLYAFDSLVIFVTAGADTTGWYAYEVTGLEAETPTEAKPWPRQIPPHVVSLVRANLP
jgi:hypothetical protein